MTKIGTTEVLGLRVLTGVCMCCAEGGGETGFFRVNAFELECGECGRRIQAEANHEEEEDQ